MPARRYAGATLALVAMLATGCSTNGDRSAPATSTVPGGTVAAAASPDPFCRFVAAFDERFGRIDPSLSDPTRLRLSLREAANEVSNAAATAPAAVKADVAILEQAYTQLLTVFEQADFDLTKVPPAALQSLQAPGFADASARLDAYRAANCR